MAEPTETCPERERLLSEWTDSARRARKILDGQYAAIGNPDKPLTSFGEWFRLAKNEEIEACRAYYTHVNKHDCV